MAVAIILASFAIVVLTYISLAIYERNYINVLTPFLLFAVPSYYVLELLYVLTFGESGSLYAYFYCYSMYAVGAIGTAVGYMGMPSRRLPILIKLPRLRVLGAPYVFLALAAVLYAPILIEYRSLLTNPREIYSLTRTGYGAQFFLSSFAVYLALILLMFSGRVSKLSVMLFSFVAVLILYMHGSKGHVLYFFLIVLYFLVFVKNSRFGLKRLAGASVGVSLVIVMMFYATLPATLRDDMIQSIAEYSDYTRNAMVVMDDKDLTPLYGKLTAEASFYSLVPRALFPDKPADFGGLWLARRYFPERFESNTGAPAFGVGIPYADFGAFSILYYGLASLLAGVIMKILVVRLRGQPDAGTFALLLTFLEVPLIPAGAAVPLLFYYLCALGIKSLSRDQVITIDKPGRRPVPTPRPQGHSTTV